jgi:hypothetical protein
MRPHREGREGCPQLLAVVPSAAKERVAASDDTIDKQVKKVIENDAALKESSIKVASVHDGTVLLSGKADTISSHQRALMDARSVPGVRKVASEITSPDRSATRRSGATSRHRTRLASRTAHPTRGSPPR